MTDQPDLFNAYPVTPGYAPTDTSKAAAEAMKPKVGPLREQVLAVLAEGDATSFEIAAALRKSYAAIQPRTSELKDLGLIIDSGKRGISRDPTKQAIVWTLATETDAPARDSRRMSFVVGMETSGQTRDAIIALGPDAVSVDLLPHQTGGPHHVSDLFAFLKRLPYFDGGVFHPDCTYHTGSASWAFKEPDFERYPGVGYHMKLKPGTLTGADRRKARDEAEEDVRRIRYLPFVKVIENPVGTLSTRGPLGRPSQIVQPYEFGSDASKKTCLWWFDAEGRPLSVLLPLNPAAYVPPRLWCPTCRQCSPYEAGGRGCVHCGEEPGLLRPRWANQTDSGQSNVTPSDTRWQHRSDTYPGIAAALAAALIKASR